MGSNYIQDDLYKLVQEYTQFVSIGILSSYYAAFQRFGVGHTQVMGLIKLALDGMVYHKTSNPFKSSADLVLETFSDRFCKAS
jgi:hypothetical protein